MQIDVEYELLDVNINEETKLPPYCISGEDKIPCCNEIFRVLI
jgi:hypothetical protein